MTDGDADATDSPPTETRQSDAHVSVSDDLRRKIARRLPATDFESVDEYVAFVLEAVLREIDERDGREDEAVVDTRETAPPDDEGVQDRLESLGYL